MASGGETSNPTATKSQDYTKWSNADLIQRVSELETQLRAQNVRHAQTNSRPSSASPKKKLKKPAKAFDPTKYSTRHIALKFAYLGGRYNGFEHHTNNTTRLPTIEEELWKALVKTKLIFPQHREGQSEDDVCWDGCEYSKCGRTDKGVSAFGQVIGLRVRSSRPKEHDMDAGNVDGAPQADVVDDSPILDAEPSWDSIKDELPYIQLLNKVLPSDIRVLAWCPEPGTGFSARFNCRERRYRYFFTNPAYIPHPTSSKSAAGDGRLDIEAMQAAAKKLEGLHDFRNFCKVDSSKQITNFERRIFSASIQSVAQGQTPGAFLSRPPFRRDGKVPDNRAGSVSDPSLYYFELRGSAFLWHQVRHIVAVLFLVGQGYELPGVVDQLLDARATPAKPMYEMASDIPLVLWDCIFPRLANIDQNDHGDGTFAGYEDVLDWIYVGDNASKVESKSKQQSMPAMQDRKWGRLGIMDDLWAMWRKRKMNEVLAGSLMDAVSRQGKIGSQADVVDAVKSNERSARLYDGSESPKSFGPYVPLMRRERHETPDVVNAKYAARKGLNTGGVVNGDVDMVE